MEKSSERNQDVTVCKNPDQTWHYLKKNNIEALRPPMRFDLEKIWPCKTTLTFKKSVEKVFLFRNLLSTNRLFC